MPSRLPLLLLALTALLALLPPGGVSVCPLDGSLALGGLAGCPCERGGEADDGHGTCEDVHSEGLLAQAPCPTPSVDAGAKLVALGAPRAFAASRPFGPSVAPRPYRGPPPRPPAALVALACVRLQR